MRWSHFKCTNNVGIFIGRDILSGIQRVGPAELLEGFECGGGGFRQVSNRNRIYSLSLEFSLGASQGYKVRQGVQQIQQ